MLVDSSAWIEYLRGSDSPATAAVRGALRSEQAHVTDVIRLEVLAGSFRGDSPADVAALLDVARDVAQVPRDDVEEGAGIYRLCRTQGYTIRALNDCVIAAIAIRTGLAVLHCDRDFDAIAQHTALKVVAG